MKKLQEKIPVAILGATGSVGQKFVELLANHPWFEIVALTASERSSGKKYRDVVNWIQSAPLDERIGSLVVRKTQPDLPCKIVFSALDAVVAEQFEQEFALSGYVVISNARNHRFHPSVPLLIPDVNPDHLAAIAKQPFDDGIIVTNPNCSTTGLVIALKPLADSFGIDKVHVVTMQALSGAGYPGVSSLQATDNVIPFIKSEEEKMESEPRKILGRWDGSRFIDADVIISASCNRVPVIDGHLESVSVKLNSACTINEIKEAWVSYRSAPQELKLPSAPKQPIHYFDQPDMPQPRLLRNLENGMAVSIGRLRPCPILDFKFTVLSHNTIRGAAGGAILNAELMAAKGYIQ
ncbi:MAG: aspartate-semialdehyde dehydrogenase [Calditrichaeota bacterium]|nr:aspartate-semialdehyde dehydrogenase [Calditrichota bacterium]